MAPEISKVHAMSSCSLGLVLVDLDIGSQLLLQRHAYLPAAMAPTTVVMDSASELETSLNSSIYCFGHGVASQ